MNRNKGRKKRNKRRLDGKSGKKKTKILKKKRLKKKRRKMKKRTKIK